MKKLFLVILFILFFCTGCVSGPSVCDSLNPGDSVLCDVSAAAGVRLEDIGNALIIANATALATEQYTVDEAIAVCNELISGLQTPISYKLFYDFVFGELADFPGLLDVLSIYIKIPVTSTDIIKQADREMLISWLEERVQMLQVPRSD